MTDLELIEQYTRNSSRDAIEELVRRAVREDRHIDDDDLRIHYRRGILRLDGTLPSDEAHERLRAMLDERFGFREIVDRLDAGRKQA